MYNQITLNYNYDSFVPYISGETIFVHFDKHYKGYLNKLNKYLKDINYNFDNNSINLVKNIDKIPINIRDEVLYNAGGVLNHELYFQNINIDDSHVPVGDIKNAINDEYGDFDNFKNLFIEKANSLVGSGYTFLVLKNNNKLDIINFSNQETPYYYNMVPIMTIDLWEHAYYLDYQNRRNEYINNFFKILSFDVVNENYKQAFQK